MNAARVDPVEEIRRRTGGRGVDVAIEVIGRAVTMKQGLRCLGPLGRAVIVGIGNEPLSVDTYRELLGNEAELIGSNDHSCRSFLSFWRWPARASWTPRAL